MPVQQQMSSFAKRLGGRVAQANAEHKDAPVDTGNRQLPSGIKGGIAKLSTMYTKQQEADDGKTPKGETFFRASAVVISPAEHDGEKIEGLITSITVPLCDVPAKGLRKAKSFTDNWFEFQNVFKLLGVAPCPETPATDPTGQRTEAYFFAAMKTLTDPVRRQTHPIYIEFSTRGWTPPASQLQPKPSEMVFETWHGLAQYNGQHDPASGVSDTPPTGHPPQSQTGTQQEATPPPTTAPGGEPDPIDLVASLVETAMNDPEGATEEGVLASSQLEDLAWAIGWTKEQTTAARDWAHVGEMALNPPTQSQPSSTPSQPSASTGSASAASSTGLANTNPTVGSKWLFAKRDKSGARLKNSKGEDFPANQVEVVTVDAAAKQCTLKTVKDGKDVVDIRTKQPVAVAFEWLEIAY